MSTNSQINLDQLNDDQLLELAESLKILDEKKRYNLQEFLFDSYRKDPKGYAKHLAFFEAGSFYKERAMIAANRTGKTRTANTEMSFHLNGRYPTDWKGKIYKEPIVAWSVGKTHETTRDILQKYLIGSFYDQGTGMIPKEDLIKTNSKSGIPAAVQDVYVRHYTNGEEDGVSELHFKSYVQGVEAFMGTQCHVIHLDEEPEKRSIYDECLTRTMTTDGIIMCTFTPLLGLSEVVLSFLPHGRFPLGGMGVVHQE